MEKDNEKELLERLKSGDVGVYETVFKKHYKLLLLEAFYLLKEELEAETLVQKIFIEFLEQERFRGIDGSIQDFLQKSLHEKYYECGRRHGSLWVT